MRARIAEVLDRKGLKLGHYVGDFTMPGIGYMLKEAGAEYVFFDMEHSGNSYDTLQRCLRYFEAAGLPSMVRVPSDGYDHIARALDCGADAVVIPMVGTADQARAIVDKMKYTPQGSRGVALALANDRYKMGPVAEALADANARTKLVCLIETAEGVANVDEIAAVDVISGIELYIERGDWDKALETAKAQEVRTHSIIPLRWQWSWSRSWRSTWTVCTRNT